VRVENQESGTQKSENRNKEKGKIKKIDPAEKKDPTMNVRNIRRMYGT
jgi:hypothetical protein